MSETADIIAVRLVAETETAERNIRAYGASLQRAMAGVELSVTRGAETTDAASRRQQAAYRDLGTAVVKVAADAIAGKNAFQIFGEQGTALAASLVGVGGTVGRVAGTLSGPWGVALTTAAALTGMFATESEAAAGAARRQGDAARDLREAMADLASATGEANRTRGEQIRQSEAATRELLGREIATRRKVIAQLAQARDTLGIATSGALAFASDGGAAAILAASRRVSALEKRKLALDRSVAGPYRQLRATEAARIRRRVEAERDPVAAATHRFEAARDRLDAAQLAGRIGNGDYAQEIRRLLDQRDRALAAAHEIAAPRLPAAAAAPPSAAPSARPDDAVAQIVVPVLPTPSAEAFRAEVDALIAAVKQVDGIPIEAIAPAQLELIGKIAATLKEDLAQGLTDAIVAGKSLGDVLVDSFARAGVALLKSQIGRLFDPRGDGSTGLVGDVTRLFGGLFGGRAPRRAAGGDVSAGRLYRVNETAVEGFRPAGSGTIVPLGRMAATAAAGGVTVVQPLNVSFAGAITTPELMAQFKAYADGVGQAAAIGGAAMAQAKIAKRAARALVR
jgi:hypothetical protein